MKKTLKSLVSAALAVSVAAASAVSAFAVSYTQSEIAAYASKRSYALEFFNDSTSKKGDMDSNGAVTTNDVKNILCEIAMLSDAYDEEQAFRADMDCNGRITLEDARITLRKAAGLDASASEKAEGLELFNAILNTVRPNNEYAKASNVVSTVAKSYDNQELVNKFNEQTHDIADNVLVAALLDSDSKKELRSFDLGKMLTEITKDDTSVWHSNGCKTVSSLMIGFPLENCRDSSFIDMSDVSDVVINPDDGAYYKEYTREIDLSTGERGFFNDADRDGIPDDYVAGHSITVYFNSEKTRAVPTDPTTLSHGKAFDIAVDINFDNAVDIAEPDSEDISSLGELTAELEELNCHDSFIKLIFNNNPKSVNYGKPILIEYNLTYDIAVYSHMITEMSLLENGKKLIDIDDYMTLTTTNNNITQYYFMYNQ